MITVLDGGMGRALSELGATIDAPLWSARAFLKEPDLIRKAHRDYVDAGAQVITTNGYALTDYYLGWAGLLDQKARLLELSYSLAKEAIVQSGRKGVRIAASIPPLNESYRPDLVRPDQLKREYPQLIAAADAGGAHILLGETLSSLVEAEAIIDASRNSSLPLWLAFTVGPEGKLRSGEAMASAATLANEAGAEAILVNCSTPEAIDLALDHILSTVDQSSIKVGAYANRFHEVPADFTLEGGLNALDDGLSCPSYMGWVDSWVQRGVSIVGGCCGIGREYIAQLARRYKP